MGLGLAKPTNWAFLVFLLACETWAVEVDVCQNNNESRPSTKPRNKIEIELSWEEGEKPYALLKSGKIENWTRNDTPIFISIRHPEYFHEEEINLNITLERCPETVSAIIVACSSALSVLVLVAVVVVLFLCMRRKRNRKSSPQREESDLNDMYGQYEFDDVNGGLVRMGSAWGTDKSPDYDYEENTYSRRSQVQVRSPYMDAGEYV